MLACVERAFDTDENEDNSLAFDVRMRTPIGIRLGHMTVCRNLGRVSGCLDILNHSEPFEGTIDDEGNCELFGKIITLMRTISYEATGKITPDSLELSITDDRQILQIFGTPCRS
ncbi:MAG: hypothetical protein ACI4WZ_00320 [Eubacteriales bacterium]